jgi:deoxyribonuclease (pyrimidine dimer)
MTRINLIPVQELTDQHAMAEYRELPMVMASARRSNPANYKPTTKYTLNSGHVTFFWNKREFLLNRWLDLIAELYDRGFNVDPAARVVHWRELDRWPQVTWNPTEDDVVVNRTRINERIAAKPHLYRYRGKKIFE